VDIYKAANVDHLVLSVVHGYNSTVMAYGQTGAGKTHTLQGTALFALFRVQIAMVIAAHASGHSPLCGNQSL
jgi:glycerate-2-kinase